MEVETESEDIKFQDHNSTLTFRKEKFSTNKSRLKSCTVVSSQSTKNKKKWKFNKFFFFRAASHEKDSNQKCVNTSPPLVCV